MIGSLTAWRLTGTTIVVSLTTMIERRSTMIVSVTTKIVRMFTEIVTGSVVRARFWSVKLKVATGTSVVIIFVVHTALWACLV